MFVGRRFSEEVLLGFAFAFEQATQVGKYRQPYIQPTADLLESGTSTVQLLHSEVRGHLEMSEGIQGSVFMADPLRA